MSAKALRRVQVGCGREGGHPQVGQLGESSTQVPETTKHYTAESTDNFDPNILFSKYEMVPKS